MSKKFIIALTVVLLVAAACNKKVQTNSDTKINTKSESSGTQSLSASNNTSLKGLIAAGKAVTCTFSDNGNTGTVYAAGGKAQTDMTTSSNGQTITAHTLIDGQTSYTWMDGQTTGFKTTLTASAQAKPSSQGNGQKVDPDKAMNYNCSAWTVDSNKFIVPVNVQFMEFGSFKIPGK
jgi:hypothetical protein